MRQITSRVGVLSLLIASLSGSFVNAGGPPAPADDSVTSCSLTPDTLTVNQGEPPPLATYVASGYQFVSGDSTYRAYAEFFIDGVAQSIDHLAFVASSGGEAPVAPPWDRAYAGQTWRIDTYAMSSSGAKVPGLVCSFTFIFGPAGSDGGPYRNIDPDYFFGRITDQTSPLPNTL